MNQNPKPTVLITGASTGIGAACAIELDRRGWQVFAGVRREEDAKTLQEMASDRLTPVMLDVTKLEEIEQAIQIVQASTGEIGLNGLINNAGIAVGGPLEAVSDDLLRKQFDVNVFGAIAVARAAMPLLRQGHGRIVFMSSISGRIAAPFLGPYAMSKFALEAAGDALRNEVRRWGIHVSLVEPGCVQTPIWEKSSQTASQIFGELTPEMKTLYEKDIEKVLEVIQKSAESAMPVERVVHVVVHALTARRPKLRYPVGFDTRIIARLLPFIPTRLIDRACRKALKLN